MNPLNPLSSSKTSSSVKPPLGLSPRKLHDMKRIEEIMFAIDRYIASEKQIPSDCLKELGDLSKATFKK